MTAADFWKLTPLELHFVAEAYEQREHEEQRKYALLAQFIRATMHWKKCPKVEELVPPRGKVGEMKSELTIEEKRKKQEEAEMFFDSKMGLPGKQVSMSDIAGGELS